MTCTPRPYFHYKSRRCFTTSLHVNGWIVKCDQKRKTEKSPASSVSPQTGMDFPVVQFLGSNSRPKPSFRHPSCARTHSAHTKVQLYRFARRAVLVHTTATSSFMCHVITWSGDVSHRSGKDMRKKDEEWPRTGTFCAAWGRISVMQWPIFTGHFGPFRLLQNWSHLTIPSVTYIHDDVHVHCS